mgnify:CR=1 FL=1
MPFSAHIQILTDFEKEKDKLLLEAVRNFEKEIILFNQEQLQDGELSTGQDITPPYRPFTISVKKGKGQVYDRVTLLDTGDYYSKFFLVYFKDKFSIESTDRKALSLELKYSIDILGLNDKNLQGTIDLLVSVFIGTSTIFFSKEGLIIYFVMIIGIGVVLYGNQIQKKLSKLHFSNR